MNANAPPEKRTGPCCSGPIAKLTGLPQSNSCSGVAQGFPRAAKISRGRGRDHSLQQLRFEIRCLRFVQTPFSWVFWALEQPIARLDDEIERCAHESPRRNTT